MKKHYKIIFVSLLAILVISNQGCDILNNYFLNLPLKEGITATGNNTTIFNSKTVYLSDYDAYSDNIDNIKNIKYVAALYRTLLRGENPSPPPDSLNLTPGLVGEKIEVTVIDGDGNLVFTRSLPSAKADDYLTIPYEVKLTPTEIDLMNKYLEGYKDPIIRDLLSFTGTITMSNISAGGGPPYTLTGQVEILLELELEP